MALRSSFIAVVLAVAFSSGLWAQDAVPAKLKVGVFDRPPLAMKGKDGKWEGLAVDLWQNIAQKLNLPYEYIETSDEAVLNKLTGRQLDLVLGELTISGDRARLVSFTQSYYESPIAVAVLREASRPVKLENFLDELVNHGVLKVIVVMLVTLVLFSILLWMVEKKVRDGHFGGNPLRGLGSAIWFSAVTMTTVGYGDKTPQTPAGRFLAFLWMFSGILLVSAFTGTVASSITVSRLQAKVDNVSDLSHYRNGVIDGSLAQEILTSIGIPARRYSTMEGGLADLKARQITAFIASSLSMGYVARRDYPGDFELNEIPHTDLRFAMATRRDAPFFDEINAALIDETTGTKWEQDKDRWLGKRTRK